MACTHACRYFKEKMLKLLEERAELGEKDTILGRLLVALTEEGVITADTPNE
jgi:hypothetical protein